MSSRSRCLSALCLILWAAAAGADPFARLNAAVDGAASPSAEAAALVARGEALRLAGRRGAALRDLHLAVRTAPSAAEQAYAAAALGVALAEAGRLEAAAQFLRQGLAAKDQPAVRAVSGATLATLRATAVAVETEAIRAARFAEAEALAAAAAKDAAGAGPLIRAIALAAGARVARSAGDAAEATTRLAAAIDLVEGAPGAAQILIGLGDDALALGDPARAARAFRAVPSTGRPGALAALGLGAAALAENRAADALAAADRAAAYAVAAAAEDVHFSADWLRAEALKRLGDAPAARAAYELAFEGLRDFRARTPLGAPPVSTARRFAPRRFQLEYIDFLFRTGRGAAELRKARDLIEDLKLDEVDDYFAERCTPARGRARKAEALGAGAVILYPIVFADRTEMIWTRGEQIGGYTVAVTSDDLHRRIGAFRYQIDLRLGGVEVAAGALYNDLVAPLGAVLAGAETLVVAPDGPLRALPFAALWDGEGFLGARVGLATILGLSLVDQGGPTLGGAVLAAGAEEVDDAYNPLPSVPLELAAISEIFGAEVLAEDAFSAAALAGEVSRKPYDIVHIATHAEFGADPSENFIITKDGRLDVAQLEATLRARAVQTSTPVGLLTLSACNTAADLGGEGAERAPLGLAGVGFRAGARSVLASLWPAEDLATAALMERFYRELKAGAGRAEALRRAQAALIAEADTADPFQWANFLLIGDWR